MNEDYFENLLNIKTTGQQTHYNESSHYNKYEATPYSALDVLFKSYKVNTTDSIIDFGCGKGRLNFYANYLFNIRVTGIEMNDYYFNECIKNKNSFLNLHNRNDEDINFVNCLAEEYKIHNEDNIFYFFNPFSVQIFMNVLENILTSLKRFKREVTIILYYPSNEYIYFLETYTSFSLSQEIKLDEFYNNDNREKFLVYKFSF